MESCKKSYSQEAYLKKHMLKHIERSLNDENSHIKQEWWVKLYPFTDLNIWTSKILRRQFFKFWFENICGKSLHNQYF